MEILISLLINGIVVQLWSGDHFLRPMLSVVICFMPNVSLQVYKLFLSSEVLNLCAVK